MANKMDPYIVWFNAYARGKISESGRDTAPLALKRDHTLQVYAAAGQIASELPAHLRHAASVAALLHDVGRFEQYLRYGTFLDAKSCNHALLSAKIIKSLNLLRGESNEDRQLILAAVALHNRFALPQGLPRAYHLVCEVVRDADKLDILRVIDGHLNAPGPYNPTVVLNLPDDPQICSDAVIAAAVNGTVAAYADLKSVNDYRLLLGTWFYDMHYATSRNVFLAAGHARNLVAKVPDNGPYAAAKNSLLRQFGGS